MVGIGFFAPFPLALMVPFMAGQSLAMGEAFGKGFQYGKRKISSMSNEEFNALNFKGLSESIATDYRVMIPSLTTSIKDSQVLQAAVFDALGDIIRTIPQTITDFFAGGGSQEGTLQNKISAGIVGGGGSPFQANLASPQGIDANMKLWFEQGAITRETYETYLAQSGQAKAKAAQSAKAKRLADDKQKFADLATERQRIAAIAFAKKQGEEQQALLKRLPVVVSKRKAGQSQINERNKLTKDIADTLKWIREQQVTLKTRPNDSHLKNIISNANLKIKKFQTAIITLMHRYTF